MTVSGRIREFQYLVLSFHPVIVMQTVEEERVQSFLHEVIRDMRMPLFEWSVSQGLSRAGEPMETPWSKYDKYKPPTQEKVTVIDKTTDPIDMMKYIRKEPQRALFWLKDFTKHLEDPTIARQFRDIIHYFSQNTSAIVLSGDPIELSRDIAHDVIFFDLKLPDPFELRQALDETIKNLRMRSRVQIDLSETDASQMVRALGGMTLKQARQVVAYVALEDGRLSVDDVPRILERKARAIHEAGILDYLPIEVNQSQLGGFAGLKSWLDRAKIGFSPEAQAFNLQPPKGVLIVGIQGCGKSLAARVIAREWQLSLLKLDAGRIYDKYVGESERNFREALRMAESMAPTILWIDEIEKSFGQSSGDADGGLSRRLFGSFLTWLQEKSQEVFVVATANDLTQIPPEFLRKGRFDEIFYVDLPDARERMDIIKIHLGLRKQDIALFNLKLLVEATSGFSGAEIEQVVVASLYRSLFLQQPLNTDILLQEIQSTIPLSISRREDIEVLRSMAQDRFVPVK